MRWQHHVMEYVRDTRALEQKCSSSIGKVKSVSAFVMFLFYFVAQDVLVVKLHWNQIKKQTVKD